MALVRRQLIPLAVLGSSCCCLRARLVLSMPTTLFAFTLFATQAGAAARLSFPCPPQAAAAAVAVPVRCAPVGTSEHACALQPSAISEMTPTLCFAAQVAVVAPAAAVAPVAQVRWLPWPMGFVIMSAKAVGALLRTPAA